MNAAAPSHRRTLHRYAVATGIATFLLLIAGSLVTSTDSGLAVPDWPLSYGTWFPPMVGGIRYEHGHRMMAGLVGLMILILAGWLWKVEPRRWVRRLGYAALGAVMLQALLGGLTVLLLLPPQISIAHACLGQTVFCLVVCLAVATSSRWEERPTPVESLPSRLRVLGRCVASLAAMQLVFGAVIRHTGYAVGWHVAGAATLALAVVWFVSAMARWRHALPSAWTAACWLLGSVGLQSFIGVSVFRHRADLLLRTSHVALGALILAQAVVLVWGVARSTRPLTQAGALRQRALDYLELTKPRLSLLVLMTTAVGCWLGLRTIAQVWLLWPLLLGTALVVGGANALNAWIERESDARMQRTKSRPLPAGRLHSEAARRFGIGLSLAGLVVLALGVNWLSALLAATSWASYILLYTPLKRRTPLCTLVGAIPGAIPPMIGWAAARNELSLEAWALFGIIFVWQLPHFLALAVLYREDYARAGFRMLTLIDADSAITARQMVSYGLVLLPVSLFPAFLGLVDLWYAIGALVLGGLLLVLTLRAALRRSTQSAQSLFRASIAYLPLLLLLLALTKSPVLMAAPSCCGQSHASLSVP